MSKIGQKIIAALTRGLLDLIREDDPRRDPHINLILDARFRDDPLIGDGVAMISVVAWKAVCRVAKNRMPLPSTMFVEGGVQCYWDRDEYHLRFEADPDESGIFIYRNRSTGEVWIEEYRLGDDLDDELVDRLHLFAR